MQRRILVAMNDLKLRPGMYAMTKIAAGQAHPVIDTRITLDQLDEGLRRLEGRDVFGKIVVEL